MFLAFILFNLGSSKYFKFDFGKYYIKKRSSLIHSKWTETNYNHNNSSGLQKHKLIAWRDVFSKLRQIFSVSF